MSSPFVHHNGEVRLVIQIPCFNEAVALPETLADLPRTVPGFKEVLWLVVDDERLNMALSAASKVKPCEAPEEH